MFFERTRRSSALPTMARIGIGRRRLLALAGLPALGLLPACSGSESGVPSMGNTVATSESVIPFAELRATTAALAHGNEWVDTRVRALEPAADRFGAPQAAFRFAGAESRASIDAVPAALATSFALSLWFRFTTGTAMQLLRLTDTGGNGWIVELNRDAGIGFGTAGAAALLAVGKVGAFCDGSWHHLLVQGGPGRFEVVVDGHRRASAASPAASTGITALQVGGEANAPWVGDVDDLRLYGGNVDPATAAAMAHAWTAIAESTPSYGTVAHLRFNGDATNATGLGLDGTVRGAVPAADRLGHATAAYAFDGLGASIEIELDESLYPAGNFALAFWAMAEGPGARAAVALTAGGGTALDIAFDAGAGLAVFVAGDLRLAAGAAGAWTDGQWHFIVVQRRDGVLEGYVDGALVGTAAAAEPVAASGAFARIGAGSGAAGLASWRGRLDEVQIYAVALSAAQVVVASSLFFRCRDGAVAAVFRERLWLLGGWNPQESPVTLNEVWSSQGGRDWTQHPDAAWSGRHTMGVVVHDGALWVLGGDKLSGQYQNEVWRSADGESWQLVTTTVPWADRTLFMTASFAGRLWVYGGVETFTDPFADVAYNDVWSSTDGIHWALETGAAPWSPRGMVLGNVVFDGRLWVVGGGKYDIRHYYNDVWSSADGRHWDLVTAAAPWSPRQYHSVIAWHGLLWVLCGSTAESTLGTSDVWVSANGRDWQPYPDAPFLARHAAAATSDTTGLWLIGGSSQQLYNDIWQLRLGA